MFQDYQFRRETAGPSTPANIIGRTRQRRSHHAIFVTYHVDKVPDKPRDVALNQIKLKFIDQERLATVKEKFKVHRNSFSFSLSIKESEIVPGTLKYLSSSLGFS